VTARPARYTARVSSSGPRDRQPARAGIWLLPFLALHRRASSLTGAGLTTQWAMRRRWPSMPRRYVPRLPLPLVRYSDEVRCARIRPRRQPRARAGATTLLGFAVWQAIW
jgi:hypothetical protein